MNTFKVPIGLLGSGARLRNVTKSLLHHAGQQIQIAAAYDPDPEAIQGLQKQVEEIFVPAASEKELIAQSDWVFIGSFNAEHARQAIAALQAGKDVFCEKPLATNLEDCLAVRREVIASKRTFFFGLVLRFSPMYRKVKELLASGAIGELVSFEFNETLSFNHGGYIFGNWRRKRALAGTHMLEKCCHDIDLANWMVDSLPVRVASFGGRDFFQPKNRRHVERIGPDAGNNPAYQGWPDHRRADAFGGDTDLMDNQVVILQYANGVRATFHTNCNAGIPERRFYLCGTEGSLRADLSQGTIEVGRIGHEQKTETYRFSSTGGHSGSDEVMAKALADTILNRAQPPATVEDGIRACVVAFAIDQATDEGAVVDLRPLWKKAGIELAASS